MRYMRRRAQRPENDRLTTSEKGRTSNERRKQKRPAEGKTDRGRKQAEGTNEQKERKQSRGKKERGRESKAIFERLRPYDAGKPDAGKRPRRKASTSGGSAGGSIAGSIPAPNARLDPFSCIRRKYHRKRSRGWFTFEKPPRQNIEKAVHVLYRVPISFDFLCRLTIIIQAFCINDIENTFSIFLVKNRQTVEISMFSPNLY